MTNQSSKGKGVLIKNLVLKTKVAPDATASVAQDIYAEAEIWNTYSHPIFVEAVYFELTPDPSEIVKPIPAHPDGKPSFSGGQIGAGGKQPVSVVLHRNFLIKNVGGGFDVTLIVRWLLEGEGYEVRESTKGAPVW